ncbi:MAG: M20/M25/M40 family metallo-hydrolase [Ignavibacteriales bacterium]|nr:M20/M25/M40 family metallo-hydrolase [Ignavibacteriales bacterium]
MKPILGSALFIAAIALIVLVALYQTRPPEALPESADSTLFSSERAMKHLGVIAAEPHVSGTPAAARVREYLCNQLSALGLAPVVQKTTITSFTQAAVVENVIATIRGTDNTKAVLLAGHYDTVFLAPGANDDGYSLAAILETVRALKSRPPLRNDLIILFTDGEEMGMLGAKAFVRQSPMADKVGFAMNFEARGSGGPSIMFETNDQNGWVVREFDRAVPRKFATSLTYALYKRLPLNTDFSVFKEKASSGLNFAHGNSVIDYHSVRDDVAHMDLRTMQHHGENMLSSALRFGNLDLSVTTAPDVVYFSFLFPSMVIYPVSWNTPIVVVATLAFVFVVFVGFRKHQLTVSRLFIALSIFVFRVVVAAGVVQVLWNVLGPLQPEHRLFFLDAIHHSDLYLGGFLALGIAISVSFQHKLAGRFGVFNLAIGPVGLWLILAWLAVFYLPGGSYIVLVPLVLTLVCAGLILMSRDVDIFTWRSLTLMVLCLTPGIFLFTQVMYILYELVTLSVAAGLVGLIVILFGTLQLSLALLPRRSDELIAGAGVVAAVSFIALALFSITPSERFPQPNSILYAYDADNGSARWISWETNVDTWTGQFFSDARQARSLPEFLPFAWRPLLTDTARVIRCEVPDIRLLSDETVDSARTLKLRVQSSSDAQMMLLNTDKSEGIYRIRMNGQPMGQESSGGIPRWPILCFGMSSAAAEMEVTLAKGRPFRLRAIQIVRGMPEAVMSTFKPRPAWMIPRPTVLVTDATVAGKTFVF